MRTKIDERREREEYDRAHPWQPLGSAVVNDGAICELLFSDMETDRSRRYFLGEDDNWYQIDPPARLGKPNPNVAGWAIGRTPMNWRSTGAKISPQKRSDIMHLANRDHP